jgi:hypothetical protein
MKLKYKHLLCAATLGSVLLLLIGSAWTQQRRGPGQTAPVLSGLNPNTTSAGVPGFSMTVFGAFFVSASVVHWNGEERPTTFVNETVVRVQIPASDVAAEGTASVTVVNPIVPNEHSGVSNILVFQIQPATSF